MRKFNTKAIAQILSDMDPQEGVSVWTTGDSSPEFFSTENRAEAVQYVRETGRNLYHGWKLP